MTYMGSGDRGPQLTDYYPEWLDNLADDVTLEGLPTTASTQLRYHLQASAATQMLISNEHLTAAELPVHPSRPPPRRTARSCASRLAQDHLLKETS